LESFNEERKRQDSDNLLTPCPTKKPDIDLTATIAAISSIKHVDTMVKSQMMHAHHLRNIEQHKKEVASVPVRSCRFPDFGFWIDDPMTAS
jgi:hypothetical protein